jgi:putative transposase
VDAVRSRRELILENAVLRHQVNVLRRSSKRPKLNLVDQLKLLIGARLLSSWRRAIAIVQPDTVLRWHRTGFRLFWRRQSRPRNKSPLPPETIDLIRDMAAGGRLWGAERIRGELLKVGIKVSKRTIQKYIRRVRGRNGGGDQRWATFLKNHAERMWVCDFIQTHDLLFRQVYAFFLVHLASRRVVEAIAHFRETSITTSANPNSASPPDLPCFIKRAIAHRAVDFPRKDTIASTH